MNGTRADQEQQGGYAITHLSRRGFLSRHTGRERSNLLRGLNELEVRERDFWRFARKRRIVSERSARRRGTYILISTSTPAGKFKDVRDSIVFAFGS